MIVSGVRRRSWLTVVGVGLVGSLLAVEAGPAEGVEGEADNGAVYSACVGPALESKGFTDVVGSFAEDAVNCLAHYGVTQGRTETTYDPGSPVSRWQMALFLKRAAGPAGIALPANPADDFTDIGGVFEAGRTAINQMAALEIMPGISATVFGPDRSVSRSQMALMLDSFLVAAEKGAGLGSGALGADTDELADINPDDDVFDDIASVTRGEYSAIRRTFELGVVRGTADGSFSPGALVTRAQMAVLITRMLAHTAARPAGVTLQAAEASVTEGESVDLVVSVRDSGLMGVPDALVDVFSSSAPDDAFGEDGRCSADDVSAVGGSGVCEVTSGDQTTDPSGDLELSTDNLEASTTLWAWTGEAGDRYDADAAEGSSIVIAVTKAGIKLRVTDDMPEGATAAEFGERVVFTLQVVDEDGNPVAKKDESVTVAAAETVTTGGDDGTSSTSSSTQTYKTDASGKIELSFHQTDPRSGSGNTGDSARLDLDITLASGSSLVLEDKTNLGKAGAGDGAAAGDAAAVWQDSAPVATTLTLSQAVEYHEASAAGNGAANVVTATLTDQYGDPVSRQKVEFASDDPAGVGGNTGDPAENTGLLYYDASLFTPNRGLKGWARWTRTTNRLGAATLSYTRDSDAAGIETITARVKDNLTDYRVYEDKWDARSGDIRAERVYHYWVEEPSKGDSVQGRLVVADAENNRLVLVGDNSAWLVEYDSNDQFSGTAGPVLHADFEKELRDNAEHVKVEDYQTDSRKVSGFTAGPEWGRLVPFGADEGTDANLLQRFGDTVAADNGVIVVGAPRYQEEGGAANAGRVYVYDGITDADPAILEPPVADQALSNSYFGSMVDISGDTIVVGTFDYKVYAYVRPSSGWTGTINTPVTLTRPSSAPALSSHFGFQVAIDGDTIAVASRRGLSIFERPSGGVWTNNGIGLRHDLGGGSLTSSTFNGASLTGVYRGIDIDGDTVVVSSPFSGTLPNRAASGVVTVFTKPAGGWVEDIDDNDAGGVRLSRPESDEQAPANTWGRGVAVKGDAVVVGDPAVPNRFDAAEHDQIGRVAVFTKPAGGWAATNEPAAVLTPPAGNPGHGFFGGYVDFSPDGSEVAVGSHYDQPGDWLGSVYVFEKPAGGWADASDSEQYVGPVRNGRFGWVMAVDSTTGGILAVLHQKKTGDSCNTLLLRIAGAVRVNYCLRYTPVYLIDR